MNKIFNRKFIILVSLIILAWFGRGVISADKTPAGKEESLQKQAKQVPVVLTKVQEVNFEKKLAISGNVEAKNFALVGPRIPGVLDEIFVDEGDAVIAGKTKLFQTDAVTLHKQVEIAKQQHEIAKCTVLEKKASKERVEADFRKAEIDYNRAKQLLADKVISINKFEQDESHYQQVAASDKHAKVLIELAAEQEKQANLNLEIAEKNLRDSLAIAPISGVVTKKFKENGEMGAVGQPVISIEDLTVVEISAFVPQEYYAEIIPGKTLLRIKVGKLELKEQAVSFKSPTISNNLRTFEIKCVVNDPPAGVAPGGIAKLEVILEQHPGLGIPREALQQRDNGYVVFINNGQIAHKVRVMPGLESNGYVEILKTLEQQDITIADQMEVVSQGQRFLEDKSLITVVAEEK